LLYQKSTRAFRSPKLNYVTLLFHPTKDCKTKSIRESNFNLLKIGLPICPFALAGIAASVIIVPLAFKAMGEVASGE